MKYLTATAVITKLQPYIAHTITFDNGSEFTRHGLIIAIANSGLTCRNVAISEILLKKARQ